MVHSRRFTSVISYSRYSHFLCVFVSLSEVVCAHLSSSSVGVCSKFASLLSHQHWPCCMRQLSLHENAAAQLEDGDLEPRFQPEERAQEISGWTTEREGEGAGSRAWRREAFNERDRR